MKVRALDSYLNLIDILKVKQIFSETNLKFYPLFYNHNIIIFISLRLKVLNFNISAFLFKVQFYV